MASHTTDNACWNTVLDFDFDMDSWDDLPPTAYAGDSAVAATVLGSPIHGMLSVETKAVIIDLLNQNAISPPANIMAFVLDPEERTLEAFDEDVCSKKKNKNLNWSTASAGARAFSASVVRDETISMEHLVVSICANLSVFSIYPSKTGLLTNASCHHKSDHLQSVNRASTFGQACAACSQADRRWPS